MQGIGIVFIRPFDVGGAGHLGWGFLAKDTDKDDVYYYGATETDPERPRAQVPKGGFIGFWREKGTKADMLAAMGKGKTKPYEFYKQIPCSPCTPHTAHRLSEDIRGGGYDVVFNNCQNHTYEILKAYGCTLPWPSSRITPRVWYDLLPYASIPIPRIGVVGKSPQ
jgi:hypothetical protein